MELRADAKWSMVIATSMGIRITPENFQQVQTSDRYFMHATSAESNVASVSSHLGLPVKVLTNFVEGSPISAFIKANLRARGMAYEGPDLPQGGAWGYRHQFNIADSGYGLRGPRVWNDRAGEVGLALDVKNFDLEKLFVDEGVKVVHLSGLIAALSPETSQFCLEVARIAKANGTKIAFDLNHRASFWKGRETELRAAFHEIASVTDILIGNEEDFQLALGIEGHRLARACRLLPRSRPTPRDAGRAHRSPSAGPGRPRRHIVHQVPREHDPDGTSFTKGRVRQPQTGTSFTKCRVRTTQAAHRSPKAAGYAGNRWQALPPGARLRQDGTRMAARGDR